MNVLNKPTSPGKKQRKTLVILLNDKVASIVMATVSIICLMSLIIPTIFEGYSLFVINYREIRTILKIPKE
jgi:TRAP-type C4-dicarboxylate transport system permease small subunit